MKRGESRPAALLLGGHRFRVSLTNADRKGVASDTARGRKVVLRVPDGIAEYMDFVRTEEPFVYEVRTLTALHELSSDAYALVRSMDEQHFERVLAGDDRRAFEEFVTGAESRGFIDMRPSLAKIRMYDRSVIVRLAQAQPSSLDGNADFRPVSRA